MTGILLYVEVLGDKSVNSCCGDCCPGQKKVASPSSRSKRQENMSIDFYLNFLLVCFFFSIMLTVSSFAIFCAAVTLALVDIMTTVST
jgi:hypothetical protein